MTCTTFSTPALALGAALADSVRIVGFGEAHAPSDFVGRTTVRHFMEDLLPGLAPRSERLLVELLAPPSGCEAARKDVQEESNAITEGQAEQNQNEYVELGHAAKGRGMVADILRPTCRDMQSISSAEVRVLAIMETIATLSVAVARGWLEEVGDERPLLVLYGGALHNDIAPRPNLEAWSYGPRLSELSGDRYVEVDLVVPELVAASESWRKFVWYDAVQALAPGQGTTLVRASERSFALVFPRAP